MSLSKKNIDRAKGFYLHNVEFEAALGRRHLDSYLCLQIPLRQSTVSFFV